MLTIAIDPVLFQSGAITIRWFGLTTAAAIGLGLILAVRSAKRAHLDVDRLLSASVWALLAGIVGARVLHVLDRLDYYLPRLSQIPTFSEGGLSLAGALLLGGSVGYLSLRRSGPDTGRYLDILAWPLLVSIALGRVGNIINGDATGAPTDLPWGVAYVHPRAVVPSPDVPVHPYAVYEMLALLGLWLAVRFVPPLRALWIQGPTGGRFALTIAGYGLIRFALGFVRADPVVLVGLEQVQVLGLLALCAVAGWFIRRSASAMSRAGRQPA